MKSLSHQVLESRRIDGPMKGDHFAVRPDLFLLPEYALALVADKLTAMGGPVVAADRVLVVADHFSPPSSVERADILRKAQNAAENFGWAGQWRLFDGISHQVLLEDPRLHPGTVVIGADSHTTTVGAAGAWAAGFGSHDLLAALRTDTIWLTHEPTVAVRIVGKRLSSETTGKDIALELFRRLGPHGFHRRGFDFFDDTADSLPFDERVPLPNMIVDGGATNGLFAQQRWDAESDRTSAYIETIEIDVDTLETLAARPGSPFDITPVRQVRGTKITQAYLGSCNGGRLADFEAAARIVSGKRVAHGIKALAVPSSRAEYLRALRAGHIETLVEAGFTILNPSCGPCGGIDKGILGAGDVCIATMNRNFRGRMGSADSDIWLANSAVVAASAIAGAIALPSDV